MTAGIEAPTSIHSDRQETAGYLKIVTLIERLHRQLLDLLKAGLEAAGETEVNNVQALLLYNIADAEMTAGELRSRGHYHGSNVSYNLKKLVDSGYIHHERSVSDRRSVRVRLTPRGHEIRNIVCGVLDTHKSQLSHSDILDADGLARLNQLLSALEGFWHSQLTGAS